MNDNNIHPRHYAVKRRLYIIIAVITGLIYLQYSYGYYGGTLRQIIFKDTNKKTVVVYSGPTSLNKAEGKNFLYLRNMEYFLEHGVTCYSDGVDVDYIIVLTQEVADYYLSPDGPITKKRQHCKNAIAWLADQKTHKMPIYESSIKVVTREYRCYDMESIRVVLEQFDLQSEYDFLVFVNCGMVGPKIGSLSPIPTNVHWTLLFTSLLTDSIRMSGLSMNPFCRPESRCALHIQSFVYAMETDTLQLMLSSGNIYDCEDDMNHVIGRYEIGMSQTLLSQGYSIAVPHMNFFELGTKQVMDQGSINETMKLFFQQSPYAGDIWNEGELRKLTETMNNEYLQRLVGQGSRNSSSEYHRMDILPWEFYVFFKASRRYIPFDIQKEVQYELNLLEKERYRIAPNNFIE